MILPASCCPNLPASLFISFPSLSLNATAAFPAAATATPATGFPALSATFFIFSLPISIF